MFFDQPYTGYSRSKRRIYSSRWVLASTGGESVAVYDQKSRHDRQPCYGCIHRLDRGIEDVYLVDPFGRDLAYSPCDRFALDYLAQHVATTFGHLFRVVQERVAEIRRQDYRRGEYRAGQTSAPGLVASRLYGLSLVAIVQHRRTKLRNIPTYLRFFVHLFRLKISTYMFLDAARQKFPQASLILLLTAVCAVAESSGADVPPLCQEGYIEPLRRFADAFQSARPTLSMIAATLLLLYSGLSLGRAALRRYLYPAHTLVGIPLAGILVMGFGLTEWYLSSAVVLTLVCMTLKRLYDCFIVEQPVALIFPAMTALGCTPLLHAPMTALVVLLIPLLLLCRVPLRSSLAAVVGRLQELPTKAPLSMEASWRAVVVGAVLPTFVVSYAVWAGGGDFSSTGCDLWHAMLADSDCDMRSYVTVPRLVLFGSALFTLICSVLLYRADKFAVGVAARKTWSFSIGIVVLLFALFALLPSVTPLSVSVAAVVSSTLMPMMYVRMEHYLSTFIFWTMAAAALWSFCI